MSANFNGVVGLLFLMSGLVLLFDIGRFRSRMSESRTREVERSSWPAWLRPDDHDEGTRLGRQYGWFVAVGLTVGGLIFLLASR